MSTISKSGGLSTRSAITLLLLAILLFFGVKFILGEVKYYSMNEEIVGRFWPVKWWLVGHLSGGILALLIGPFQFWSDFRNKYFKVHRRMGRVYLVAIVIASICSTYMVWTTAAAIHWTWAFSLQILALAWFTTAMMAYRSIRLKKIDLHRQWMIRSYIVTFGFVAFRFLNDTPFLQDMMGTFVERGPTIVWIVWAIPLFIAQIVFDWKKN